MGMFFKFLVETLKLEGPYNSYDDIKIDGRQLFKLQKSYLKTLFPLESIDALWMHTEALKFGKNVF